MIDETLPPRPGARGPRPDTATTDRCFAIRRELQAMKFTGSYTQIAAVLSFERGDVISANAVRQRMIRDGRDVGI